MRFARWALGTLPGSGGGQHVEMVDSHHHLWERGRFLYSWLSNAPAIDRDFLLADYEAATTGHEVSQSVFVEADCENRFGLQEARWAASLVPAPGPVAAVVAWAPIERPQLDAHLETLSHDACIKGVRRLIQAEPDLGFCARPEFVAGVRKLPGYGLSFDACVYHPQLPALIRLVRQAPEVTVVLDHIGKPDIAGGVLDPWRQHMRELAGLPNVFCKLSGLATEADWERWQPADLQPYIEHVIDCFGFGRLMFGSDWPVSTQAVGYGRWLEIVRDSVHAASTEEKELLFAGTARKVYRLDQLG